MQYAEHCAIPPQRGRSDFVRRHLPCAVACRSAWLAFLLLLSIPAPGQATGALWAMKAGTLDEAKAAVAVEVSSPAAVSPGTLEVICYPAGNVGLYVELEIADAEALADVDFNDYEGPDAPYNKEKLAQLTLTGADGSVTITSNGAGWYSAHDSFMLSLALDYLSPTDRARVHQALQQPLWALELAFRRTTDGAIALRLRAPGESTGLLRELVERCEKSFKGRPRLRK